MDFDGWNEWLLDEMGGVVMHERRGYKEKCWRKERKGNSFRNAVPQWVGQPSVMGRLADRPIDR